ncbi:MAG: hypothetical protein ABIO70_05880 [Pseudomonadota bacterium]
MRLAPLALLLLLPACHPRYKHAAPTLGAVRVQTLGTGTPYVNLGKVYTDSNDAPVAQIAAAVINTVQVVKEIDRTERIAGAVRTGEVKRALSAGLQEAMGDGPPFAITEDGGVGNVFQIEVLSYGLNVPWLGAPGSFTYDLRLRIYQADGRRVYAGRHHCDARAGNPSIAEQALFVVDNVRNLDEMSDDEISGAFETIAFWCGEEIVAKLRRQAG